jgi:hypothetical protein
MCFNSEPAQGLSGDSLIASTSLAKFAAAALVFTLDVPAL